MQRTVNPSASPSMVRIHPRPPNKIFLNPFILKDFNNFDYFRFTTLKIVFFYIFLNFSLKFWVKIWVKIQDINYLKR